jgi:hypothetical protein
MLVAKTCLICRELKLASEFAPMTGGYWDSYCKPCHRDHGRPSLYKRQETTLKGAEKHRAPWSEGDIQLLSEMISDGLTGPQMALVLNRSMYAVYTMSYKIRHGER